MRLTMLGTGHATVTRCYNTCFLFTEGNRHFLVDGGGGNGILRQLKQADIDWRDMGEMFVTHKHMDHILGIFWLMRMICQAMRKGTYREEVRLYGHEEVIGILRDTAPLLLSEKEAGYIGKGLFLIPVSDGETREILGRQVTFFDIHSTKAKQFGFCMELDGGENLTCCGDEPCGESGKKYAENSRWLLHEAFCLHSEADEFEPYEKHHSTVLDACRIAEELHVQNLLLYHTEDKNLEHRKELYRAEGQPYYRGCLWIPEDLETIELLQTLS